MDGQTKSKNIHLNFGAESLSSVVAKHNKESKKHVQYYMVISLMTVID